MIINRLVTLRSYGEGMGRFDRVVLTSFPCRHNKKTHRPFYYRGWALLCIKHTGYCRRLIYFETFPPRVFLCPRRNHISVRPVRTYYDPRAWGFTWVHRKQLKQQRYFQNLSTSGVSKVFQREGSLKKKKKKNIQNRIFFALFKTLNYITSKDG